MRPVELFLLCNLIVYHDQLNFLRGDDNWPTPSPLYHSAEIISVTSADKWRIRVNASVVSVPCYHYFTRYILSVINFIVLSLTLFLFSFSPPTHADSFTPTQTHVWYISTKNNRSQSARTFTINTTNNKSCEHV